MSTIGKPKFSHPNKLVVQHEVFLTNKSLVTKMRSAKSSIPRPNKEFDKKIENRKKKGMQNIQNLQNSGPAIDEETLQAILDQRINLLTAPTLRSKQQDIEVATKDQRVFRDMYELAQNSYQLNQYQLPRTASTQDLKSKRSSSLINKLSSPKQPRFLPPLRLTRKFEPSPNTQLEGKELEIQAIKEELKDWWHEDFKDQASDNSRSKSKNHALYDPSNQKPTYSKENREPRDHSYHKKDNKLVSENQIESKRLKKLQIPSIRIKKITNKIANPKKETNFEGNSKKDDDVSEKQEDTLRPCTVKLPLKPFNHEFKIRSSSYLDGTSNKRNTRYDASPTQKPKEDITEIDKGTEDILNENVSTSDEPFNQNQQHGNSPHIAVTSKTLMHQIAKKLNYSHHQIPQIPKYSSEHEIKWKTARPENIKSDDFFSEEDEMHLSVVNPMDIL